MINLYKIWPLELNISFKASNLQSNLPIFWLLSPGKREITLIDESSNRTHMGTIFHWYPNIWIRYWLWDVPFFENYQNQSFPGKNEEGPNQLPVLWRLFFTSKLFKCTITLRPFGDDLNSTNRFRSLRTWQGGQTCFSGEKRKFEQHLDFFSQEHVWSPS